MSHGRDKQGREKRKPKKEKAPAAKPRADSEVIQHVQGHTQSSEDRRSD
jgi:hypothetical protein